MQQFNFCLKTVEICSFFIVCKTNMHNKHAYLWGEIGYPFLHFSPFVCLCRCDKYCATHFRHCGFFGWKQNYEIKAKCRLQICVCAVNVSTFLFVFVCVCVCVCVIFFCVLNAMFANMHYFGR